MGIIFVSAFSSGQEMMRFWLRKNWWNTTLTCIQR